MPAVSTLAELSQAVADFAVTSLGLPYESTALAAARTSLDEAGLLLLGEVLVNPAVDLGHGTHTHPCRRR